MAPQPSFLKPVIVTAALTIGLVLSQSSIALLLWVLDGTVALIILAVATVSGFGLLSLFRLGPLPRRWQLMLAAGLGVGFLSLMVLGCGVSGLVGADRRLVPAGILALCALAGLRPLLKLTKQAPTTTESSGAACWIIAAVAPFAALAMLVATLPPGFLWREEGFGYDVLEYHLQLPREYYEAGVIAYLPHNVYANFPSAAEMLYLIANIVTGESIESWSVAKCLNAILGGLAVVAGYLAAGERSVRSGMVTAVLIASAPWLVYLSGVAYVENGLLFLGMLSAACVIRAAGVDSPRLRYRWTLLAGAMSGLACGFKYTGAAMVALPLGVMLLVLLRVSRMDRLRSAACFAFADLVTF